MAARKKLPTLAIKQCTRDGSRGSRRWIRMQFTCYPFLVRERSIRTASLQLDQVSVMEMVMTTRHQLQPGARLTTKILLTRGLKIARLFSHSSQWLFDLITNLFELSLCHSKLFPKKGIWCFITNFRPWWKFWRLIIKIVFNINIVIFLAFLLLVFPIFLLSS